MKKPLPPTYFLGALILSGLLHFIVPLAMLLDWPWRGVGVLPLIVGIVLNMTADKAFKQRNTAVKPFEESSVLITDGVFRLSRNPMYLGMVMILIGVALLAGSATPWTAVVLFAVLMDRLFMVPEERMLEQKFGEAFSRYKRNVRRWI